MIGFLRPELLWLALVWLVLWAWFARHQRRACGWIWERVDERFRERFTLYRASTLGRQLGLFLVLGLLLIIAAAGPTVRGETEVRELSGRLVVLLDGSASMLADDVATAEGRQTRFNRGREIAAELSRRLEGSQFALVVFSGVAALQLPLTADQATIAEAMTAASFHTFYRSSGSSFAAALDAVLHFVEPGRKDLQAILLSDGEQPFAEPFAEPLAALAKSGVPVHTVAIGSREGQSRVIYDFRDVVAGKEEKTVLREFTTRREDRYLRRIAGATGGRFTGADDGAADELEAAVRRRIERGEPVRAEGDRDLSAWPLALFLAGFLLEALVWGRRRRRPPAGFDLRRLGGRPAGATALALVVTGALVAGSCRNDTPLARASRENERGIAADALESWAAARVHYDRSRAYEIRAEIPAYNLARSVTLQEDWSEAHRLYQRALELEPALAPAHYNDGHALYRWGEAELDLALCEIERTLELWHAAARRFASAAELSPEEGPGLGLARRNHRFVLDRIAAVEETCRPPEPQGGGGGASGGGGGGEGEQEQESAAAAGEGEPQGEPGEGSRGGGAEEEDQGGSGGGGEQEQREGGGSGEDESQEEPGEQGGGGAGEEDEEDEAGAGAGEEESEGEAGEGDGGGGAGEEEQEDGGEGEAEGDSGGGEPDPVTQGERGGGDGSPAALNDQELEQIRQALERIGAERFADGRYHYRSGPEQFPREVWENPEAEIWW